MSQRNPFDRRGGPGDSGQDDEEEQSQGSPLSRLNPFGRRDNPPGQPPAGKPPAPGRQQEDQGGGLLGGIRSRLPFGGGQGGQQGGQQGSGQPPRQQGGGRPPAGAPPGRQQQQSGGGILGGIRSRLPFGGQNKEDDQAPGPARGGQPPARPGGSPFPGSPGAPRPGGQQQGGLQTPPRPGGQPGGTQTGGAPRPGGGFPGATPPGGQQRPGGLGSPGGQPPAGAPRPGGFQDNDDDFDNPLDSGAAPGGGFRSGGQPGGSPRPGGLPGSQPGGVPRPGGLPGSQSGGGQPGGVPRPGGLPGSGPGSPGRPGQPGGLPGGGQSGTPRPGGLPGSQPGGGQPGGAPRPGGLPGSGPGSPGRPGQPSGLPGGGQPGGAPRPGGFPGSGLGSPGQQGGLPGGQPGGGQSGAPRPGGLPGSGPGSPGRPGQSGGLPGGQPGGSRPGGLPGSQPGGAPRPGGFPGSQPGSPSRPGGLGGQPGGTAQSGPSAGLGASTFPGAIGTPGAARGAGSPTKPQRGGRAGSAAGTRPRAPEAEPLLSLDTKLDIVGIVLIVIALVTVLSFLTESPGSLMGFWLTAIRQFFGWGAYIVPVALGGAGVWLLWRHFGDQLPLPQPLRVVGAVLLALGALTLIQAITVAIAPIGQVYLNPAYADPTYPNYTVNLVWEKAEACSSDADSLLAQGWVTKNLPWNSYQVARCGYGGGFVGYFLQKTMADLMGDPFVFVISIVSVGGGALLFAQKSLKDAMLAGRTQVQNLRNRQAGVTTPATAYQHNEKGEMVPIQPAGAAEQVVATPRPKPAPVTDKPEEKPTAVSTTAAPQPPPAGRPSIVTGMGPGSSPTAPPKPAIAAPLPTPPPGAPPTSAPASPAAPSSASPGAGSQAPAPGSSAPAPRPVLPGSPSRSPLLPGGSASPNALPPTQGNPGASAPPPAIPGAGSPLPGGSIPGKPSEDSARPGGLPAPARPGGSSGGLPLPGSRPPSPIGEAADESKDGDDDEGNPKGPGNALGAPPRPGTSAPTARPQPGQPPASGLQSGSSPAQRPPAPPSTEPLPRPMPAPGVGPGAQAGRTFGPSLPGSMGGSNPPPRPMPGAPSKPAESDDSLDALRPKSDMNKSSLGEEPVPPSDQIIKELVSEGKPATGPLGNRPTPPPLPPKPASTPAQAEQAPSVDRPKPSLPVAAPPSTPSPSAPPRPTPVAAAVPPAAEVKPPVSAPAKPEAPVTGGPTKIESPIKPSDKNAWGLPALDSLQASVQKSISDEELRQRAMMIEQTLSSFGAPGRVVEVNHGPVITQFGVEPDYIDARAGKRIKVKVGKISALSDDLALALAAPSIRIEAPVPGKGYVGIEVPNATTSIVGLRDVMDTPEFRNMKTPLRIALGQDVSGQPIVADMTAMPHLLIAGTTGSGKSVCVNGIIATMLMTCSPDDLKMIMVDPKRVELTNYNGIPHLMAPVVTELERIVGVLKWVQREMDDRYRRFAMEGARNISDYNGRALKGQIKGDKLPYILVIVDELADLMMLAPDETERVITRLAQMARATGIHIIISTQRPSVDVVTGLIKANFPARIAFAVATGVDSRVILDTPGAEKLLGRGDMLFQAPDAPMPLRMQGIYVSDKEIQGIVDHWRKQATERGHVPPTLNLASTAVSNISNNATNSVPAVQRRLFEGVEEGSSDDADDLFDEAVELVRGMEKASISLLQRHLRIGYTRAARLIDLMEERAVIGPHEGGSKPRVVLGPDGKPLRDLDDEEEEDTPPGDTS